MEAFYKLLVKDSLAREDVEAMEKENLKNFHEIQQMFQDSNGIYHSYITKSTIQIVIGSLISALLIWIYVYGLSGEDVFCTVFERQYVCVVPLARFYSKVSQILSLKRTCQKYPVSDCFNFYGSHGRLHLVLGVHLALDLLPQVQRLLPLHAAVHATRGRLHQPREVGENAQALHHFQPL